MRVVIIALLLVLMRSAQAASAVEPTQLVSPPVVVLRSTNHSRVFLPPGNFERPSSTVTHPRTSAPPERSPTFSRPESTFTPQVGTFSRPGSTFTPQNGTFSRPGTTFQNPFEGSFSRPTSTFERPLGGTLSRPSSTFERPSAGTFSRPERTFERPPYGTFSRPENPPYTQLPETNSAPASASTPADSFLLEPEAVTPMEILDTRPPQVLDLPPGARLLRPSSPPEDLSVPREQQ